MGDDFYLDLLFFHVHQLRYVVVELKSAPPAATSCRPSGCSPRTTSKHSPQSESDKPADPRCGSPGVAGSHDRGWS